MFISAGAILARFSLNQHAWWTLPLSIGSYLACVHLLTHGSRLGLPHIPGIRDMRRRGLGWIAPVLKPDLILSVIGS
ncbi:MAG TPA: hypothetical protein PK765_03885 [bacterium]|nr:hypothetical protein [bacterium]